jgi:hypothetical protein
MLADPNLPDWRERGRGIGLILGRRSGAAAHFHASRQDNDDPRDTRANFQTIRKWYQTRFLLLMHCRLVRLWRAKGPGAVKIQ